MCMAQVPTVLALARFQGTWPGCQLTLRPLGSEVHVAQVPAHSIKPLWKALSHGLEHPSDLTPQQVAE